jgi:hypothetical protein
MGSTLKHPKVHPSLFFPIAGAMLALVAVTNFSAKKWPWW